MGVKSFFPGRKLIGTFVPQAVIDDHYLECDDGCFHFDATDAYLRMNKSSRRFLLNDSEESENLFYDSHVPYSHSGPFSIRIEAALKAFYHSNDSHYREFLDLNPIVANEISVDKFANEIRNKAYDKFDTNGDCRECQYHISRHALQAGTADCRKQED